MATPGPFPGETIAVIVAFSMATPGPFPGETIAAIMALSTLIPAMIYTDAVAFTFNCNAASSEFVQLTPVTGFAVKRASTIFVPSLSD